MPARFGTCKLDFVQKVTFTSLQSLSFLLSVRKCFKKSVNMTAITTCIQHWSAWQLLQHVSSTDQHDSYYNMYPSLISMTTITTCIQHWSAWQLLQHVSSTDQHDSYYNMYPALIHYSCWWIMVWCVLYFHPMILAVVKCEQPQHLYAYFNHKNVKQTFVWPCFCRSHKWTLWNR